MIGLNQRTAASALQPIYLADFTRGVMPSGWTATRASSATYFDSAGILQTAGINVARFGYDLDTLSFNGLMGESQMSNTCLWCRDWTNVAWTKTNVTAVKDQTGLDGTASSATSLTATADNGTAFQSLVIVSGIRQYSVFIKRITGTGNIDISINGGSTYTSAVVTSSWKRFWVPVTTLTNPSIGIRIATSGDAVAVDYAQLETGLAGQLGPQSPVLTTTVAVTRSKDILQYSLSSIPGYNSSQGTVICTFKCISGVGGADSPFSLAGNSTNYIIGSHSGFGTYNQIVVAGSAILNKSMGIAQDITKFHCSGITWKTANQACATDQGTVQTSVSATVPSANLTMINLGDYLPNGVAGGGFYWKKILITNIPLYGSSLKAATANT